MKPMLFPVYVLMQIQILFKNVKIFYVTIGCLFGGLLIAFYFLLPTISDLQSLNY